MNKSYIGGYACGDPLRDRRRIGRHDFPARRRSNDMIVAHSLRMNRMEALNAE